MLGHKAFIERIMDPFSIHAQMSNICVLIVAYVTITEHKETQCQDANTETFLYIVWYGSNIICFVTLSLSVFYMLGIVDFCFNKIIKCGDVCLTINALFFLVIGVLYHCMVTIYGLWHVMWGKKSPCLELEIFKKIVSFMYLLWFLVVLFYAMFNCYRQHLRKSLTRLNKDFAQV